MILKIMQFHKKISQNLPNVFDVRTIIQVIKTKQILAQKIPILELVPNKRLDT